MILLRSTVKSRGSQPARSCLESTGDDYEPCLDRSQLHVYFTSDRASSTNADPWRASRASTAEPFGSIMLVPELASPLEDGTVWIHDAGLIALFHSYRNGMGSDLYQATRASVNDPFGNIAPIAGIMTGAREEDAWMSQDGHTLLFVSNVTGNRELYIATR